MILRAGRTAGRFIYWIIIRQRYNRSGTSWRKRFTRTLPILETNRAKAHKWGRVR